MTRVNGCLLCSGTKLSSAFKFGKAGYARCESCGLLINDPFPTASDLDAYYAAASEDGSYDDRINQYDEMRKESFKRYLRSFESITGSSVRGKRTLDVGCFNGVSLAAIAESGGEPYGIEMQPKAAARAAERFPGRVFNLDIGSQPPPAEKFELITMTDVIEHFLDPVRVIKSLAETLLPGGHLLLTTPNSTSLVARLLGRHWPSLMPVHHPCIFSAGNISRLFNGTGLELSAVRPLFKYYSSDYVILNLQNFGHPNLKRVVSLVPAPLRRIKMPFNGGEMLVVAAKRQLS